MKLTPKLYSKYWQVRSAPFGLSANENYNKEVLGIGRDDYMKINKAVSRCQGMIGPRPKLKEVQETIRHIEMGA